MLKGGYAHAAVFACDTHFAFVLFVVKCLCLSSNLLMCVLHAFRLQHSQPLHALLFFILQTRLTLFIANILDEWKYVLDGSNRVPSTVYLNVPYDAILVESEDCLDRFAAYFNNSSNEIYSKSKVNSKRIMNYSLPKRKNSECAQFTAKLQQYALGLKMMPLNIKLLCRWICLSRVMRL